VVLFDINVLVRLSWADRGVSERKGFCTEGRAHLRIGDALTLAGAVGGYVPGN